MLIFFYRLELKQIPFRHPQELGTLERNADYAATFLVFLLKHQLNPNSQYSVVIHPQTFQCLNVVNQLAIAISKENISDEKLQQLVLPIHEAMWSILRHSPLEANEDEMMDPFTRFLIASCLQDDFGTFLKASQITPLLSEIQFCWRATGLREIIEKKHLYENQSFAYVSVIYFIYY